MDKEGIKYDLFSSPLGDIYFSIMTNQKLSSMVKKFSSPLGDIYFLMESLLWIKNWFSSSRPLSGISISQLNDNDLKVVGFTSSRPLSGISISQYGDRSDILSAIEVLVPSRGYLFLNELNSTQRESVKVLVPSRGYLFLNLKNCGQRTQVHTFSSPLGDIYFSMRRFQTFATIW